MAAATRAPTLGTCERADAIAGATVVTEASGGYVGPQANGFNHIHISHSVGEYLRDMAHTNGIESFWSLLKRGCMSIYQFMNAKHPHYYVNRYAFRQNTARAGTMPFIDITLRRGVGKRRMYKSPFHA